MRIVYMGTPEFAVPALEALIKNGQSIELVVTKADRPQKRGRKVIASPVKQTAEKYGIPIVQPERVKGNTEFFNLVTNAAPDLIVVAAYGKILPLEILEIPTKGAINIHASLLPKYRGSAPIHRAVENGDEKTGVTLMYMSEEMDTGDIITEKETPIADKTTGMLYEELAELGAKLLIKTLPAIESDAIIRTPQDNSKSNYAPPVKKVEGYVNFHKSGDEILRKIQAMTPFPGAYTFYNNNQMKIIRASKSEEEFDNNKQPGVITKVENNGLTVNTKSGNKVILKEIQMPGKRKMEVADYLKGNVLEEGTAFGNRDEE